MYTPPKPEVQHLMNQLQVNANLPGPQRNIAEHCLSLAESMLGREWNQMELAAGLRKLLEAKDCFVRASLNL